MPLTPKSASTSRISVSRPVPEGHVAFDDAGPTGLQRIGAVPEDHVAFELRAVEQKLCRTALEPRRDGRADHRIAADRDVGHAGVAGPGRQADTSLIDIGGEGVVLLGARRDRPAPHFDGGGA